MLFSTKTIIIIVAGLIMMFSGFVFAISPGKINQISNLSEINPLKSLGNVTAPLDNIWRDLSSRLNIKLELPENISPEPLKSLENQLAVKSTLDNVSVWQVLTMAKSAFILIAQILITVMETAIWVLKGILNYFTG